MGHCHAADILSMPHPSTTNTLTPHIVLDNTPVTVSTKREIGEGVGEKIVQKWRKQKQKHWSQGHGGQGHKFGQFNCFHQRVLHIFEKSFIQNTNLSYSLETWNSSMRSTWKWQKKDATLWGQLLKIYRYSWKKNPCSIWYRVLFVKVHVYSLCYRERPNSGDINSFIMGLK